MNNSELYAIVSALVFASDQPLSEAHLLTLVQTEHPKTTAQDIAQTLERLEDALDDSGLVLSNSAAGLRIQVATDKLDWVYKLYQQTPPKLSRALLETLAIMAHRQPITRAEVEEIRGVSVSSQIMSQLKAQGWVKSAGVKDVPGHPNLWVTTPKLLEDLGLANQEQLLQHLDQIVQDFFNQSKA